ncbi:MAG: MATE family efflux transporter [Lachnospiraceae bacterium]
MGSQDDTNLMTEGSVRAKMVRFAIPIFVGNLFQQLYNAVDSLIVGNFVGSSALAAVSSTGNLVFLIIGFFNGMAVGEGVVAAHFIGAGDDRRTSLAVHTATALGLVISVLMTAVGVLGTPVFLRWMGTPDSVMPEAVLYLRIYFAGVAGLVLYNTFVGLLQAAGDSKHPLYYLIFSSMLNVVLDLLFIAVFRMGVAGAALATVMSQILSAILSLARLMRAKSAIRIDLRKIRFTKDILAKMIRIGIPSGVQNSIIGLSNVVIQSYINLYGELAMAGIGAYSKVEGFAFIPVTSFSMALTTFVSQNLGAGKQDRVRQGVRFGTAAGLLMASAIGIAVDIFAPQLIGAFNSSPGVVAYGTGRARVVCPFFCLVAFTHLMAAILRGYGRAGVPMVVFIVCWCVVRLLIIAIGGQFIHTIYLTHWVYPITWTLSAVSLFVYYRKEEKTLLSHSEM